MKIALSQSEKISDKQDYHKWLKAALPETDNVDVVLLPAEASIATEELKQCSGLLFAGQEGILSQENKTEITLLEAAWASKVPVLAIGQGMHLLNTYLEGEPQGVQEGREKAPLVQCPINVSGGTILLKISKETEGEVLSSCMQTIDKVAEHLAVAATSPEGIIQAVEWKSSTPRSFLLGIQWHPEKMDFSNPFSSSIAKHFLFEVQAYEVLMVKL